MQPFMYLLQDRRDRFKQELDVFVNTYLNKLAPVFESIDEEANAKAEEHFREIGASFNPDYDDPADYAERAFEKGLEYWEGLSLMQYNTRLMSISTLYQFWEQQIRSYAFKELTRHHILNNKNGKKFEFKDFCTKFNEIEAMLIQCGVDTKFINSWSKIKELQLLQNVIKHGDGSSAAKLMEIRPDLFRKVGDTKIMDLYLTILNEQALEVKDDDIIEYGHALNEFWDELPERMYLKIQE